MNVVGGVADAASVSSGGTMNVSSGGTASGVSVGSGGTLNVSSGGVISALTIKDPNDPGVTAAVNVLSGGTVDGATKINGGQLILGRWRGLSTTCCADNRQQWLANT